jgi:predicted DNA-binding transcriptional regulator YafY
LNNKGKILHKRYVEKPFSSIGAFLFYTKNAHLFLFLLKCKHMFFYNVTKEEGAAVRGLLLNALESQEPLEIIYLSDQGKLSQRVIILKSVGDTHIRAFCKLRKQWRIFKLSNILSARLARKRNEKRKWAS